MGLKMKQSQNKQLRECLASTLSTLQWETRRISSNLSVLHMLIESMRALEISDLHIDIVQSVRLALIDSLGEIEKTGDDVYKILAGAKND
jgi:hypothetical protein